MYIINCETKVITFKQNEYYNTLIIDGSKKKYSVHHPMKIFEYNCSEYGGSLSGGIEIVQKILKSKTKLPIPIMPLMGIFMFPTTSDRKANCAWLAYYQIKKYEERDKMTYVYFKDNTGMYFNISYKQFDSQFKRTSQVIAAYLKFNFF